MTDDPTRRTPPDPDETATPDDPMAHLIPWHARPGNLGQLLGRARQAGYSDEQLAAVLTSTSWAGRGPGYAVAVLRTLVAKADPTREGSRGPDPGRARRGQTTDPGPLATASPALLAVGVGGVVPGHRYVPATETAPYCHECHLPASNRVHS